MRLRVCAPERCLEVQHGGSSGECCGGRGFGRRRRTARFAAYGAMVHGPSCHFFYRWLDGAVVGTGCAPRLRESLDRLQKWLSQHACQQRLWCGGPDGKCRVIANGSTWSRGIIYANRTCSIRGDKEVFVYPPLLDVMWRTSNIPAPFTFQCVVTDMLAGHKFCLKKVQRLHAPTSQLS